MGFNTARKIFLSTSFELDRPTTTSLSATGNSEWLYLGGGYAEILDFLCSPVTGPANVKVLVSEPGLGKTVLLRSAIERMKGEARTAFVFWTLFEPKDFVEHLLSELGSSEPPPLDLDAAQGQFENLLRREADGKRLVLAIDDAHNLTPATLRSLSALLDRDTALPPQVTLLLAGLPVLQDQLADPDAGGIRDRIAGVRTIAPLNVEQTAEYIRARMTALGSGPVSPEQSAKITASSGGVLRNIDKLCHELPPQNESWQQRIKNALRVDQPDEPGVDAPVASRIEAPANQIPITQTNTPANGRPGTRIDMSVNQSSITTAAHVTRIAAWATDRPGMWSGTMGELAADTGISVEEVSDAVENRTQELRKSGIAATVQRAPGRPRMITLSRVEPEPTIEQHGPSPVRREEDGNRQPKNESQERATQPASHQEAGPEQEAGLTREADLKVPVSETALPWIKEFREPSSANRRQTSQELATDSTLDQEAGREQESVSETGLHWTHTAEEPSSGLAWKAAVIFAVIIAIAVMFVYLRFPHSAHQVSSAGQHVSQPKQSSEVDEVTGLLTDRHRLALYEQAAAKGDAVAQRRLGLALSLQSGGSASDRIAAYAWLVMAQNGGQSVDKATMDSLTRSLAPGETRDARYRLGMMYEQGIGSVPNLVLADQWFLLGAAVGDARSRSESATLERRMSPGQISQAHSRVDDLLRRHAT